MYMMCMYYSIVHMHHIHCSDMYVHFYAMWVVVHMYLVHTWGKKYEPGTNRFMSVLIDTIKKTGGRPADSLTNQTV